MIIELKDVVYKRGSRYIFNGLDMGVSEGSVCGIMGPSGVGKTTLLNLITGQLKPLSGTVRVLGERVDTMGERGLINLRKKMSMLFQSGALFTDMSVYDNVAFPLRENSDLSESMIRTIVMMKLETVGLRGAAQLMPAQLSGGMNRRVALARAIALDPSIMFYDEPFTGQDPISMGALVHLIKKFNDLLNLTSILVSHDIFETMSIVDNVIILSDAKVIASGSPDELKNSDSEWVSQFVHAKADGPVAFHYPAKDYLQDVFGEGQ